MKALSFHLLLGLVGLSKGTEALERMDVLPKGSLGALRATAEAPVSFQRNERGLQSRYSGGYHTNSKYHQYNSYQSRNQSSTFGHRTSSTMVVRGLLYGALVLFILALAFPVGIVALGTLIRTLCCTCFRHYSNRAPLNEEYPGMELGGPTTDYHAAAAEGGPVLV